MSRIFDFINGPLFTLVYQTALATLLTVAGAATLGRNVNEPAAKAAVGSSIMTASSILLLALLARTNTFTDRLTGAHFCAFVMCLFNAGGIGQLVLHGTSETFTEIYQNTAVGMAYLVAFTVCMGLCKVVFEMVTASSSDISDDISDVNIAPPSIDTLTEKRVFVVVEMPGDDVQVAYVI